MSSSDGWITVSNPSEKRQSRQQTRQAHKPQQNESSSDSQDWNTLTIHRPLTRKQMVTRGMSTVMSRGSIGNRQSPQINTRKIEESDTAPKTVPSSLSRAIRDARMNHKNSDGSTMTQKQLATASNLPVSVIRDYENGNAILNSTQTQKIGKTLGVQLKIE